MQTFLVASCVLVLALIVITIGIGSAQAQTQESTVGKVEWDKLNYNYPNETRATVIVTDPDMNKYPNAIEYVWVTINSDSNPDSSGIRTPLFETDFDSGIFEKLVRFVDSPPSARGFLYVENGDTISAKYLDTRFPKNYTVPGSSNVSIKENGLQVSKTAFIGTTGPPAQRMELSNFSLLDIDRQPTDDNSIVSGRQIRLVSDLENLQNKSQHFAYIVQIKNQQGNIESLSWITGNMTSYQNSTVGVTWRPTETGLYTAEAFVWEGIDDPSPLSEPLELEFEVR